MPEALQRFERFQRLSPAQREALARRLEVFNAVPGECLLELGSTTDKTLYLLEGKVELRAEDGAVRLIDARDPAARMPISRLRPSLYRVTARSVVRYFSIDNALLEELLQFERSSSILSDDSYLVEESELQSHSETERVVAARILEDLRRERLSLPLLPGAGERAGRAILAAGDNKQAIVQALMSEPALAARIIQTASRHRGGTGIDTVAEAVHRLGAHRVASAAVNSVLRETLRSRNRHVRNAMRQWWKRSLRVAAVSRQLARRNERFDPELAATAGLLYRIGEPVLLAYANLLHPRIEAPELQELLSGQGAAVTRLVIAMGHYGNRLKATLNEADNPLRDHPGPADHADILLVARRHAEIGDASRLGDLPAAKRLGLSEPAPSDRRIA